MRWVQAAARLARAVSGTIRSVRMALVSCGSVMANAPFSSACTYAIGAVVGLIGGVKVYGKFSSGDPDVSKVAASWFGACIFLIVAATILRSFFL